MYDKTMTCEYTTDDEYRACLLRAFGMTEYSDEIVAEITALYESPQGKALYPEAAALAESNGMPHDIAFCLLFNFDHFKKTHSALAQ